MPLKLYERNGQLAQPIIRYPDEPHPDNKWEWQCWWIKRFYEPDAMLTAGDLVLMNQCWLETKARWNIKVAKTKTVLQPFDKSHVIESLRGLVRYLTTHRRKHQRGTPDYRIMTDEIRKVRDLIALVALE